MTMKRDCTVSGPEESDVDTCWIFVHFTLTSVLISGTSYCSMIMYCHLDHRAGMSFFRESVEYP